MMLALAARAEAIDWQLHPAEGGRGVVLTFDAGQRVSYRFECTVNDVIVTQKGVTKLMDLKNGQTVGDDAQAVMSPGAAMMALFGGKGDPRFIPADAVKNPAGGWDLTIHLLKGDKQLTAIGKSEMMSLFTTGYTTAVVMDATARAKWSDFMQRCEAAA
ncbi:hypothetical protein G4G27_09375 [Sphingomonas sp. So64.6b]|uniref:hypothetical protein n=1 Tax=Sphingomonas sp. So64.6b TaxID=2997354 RepID=UPI0015FF00F6|nr:hypothetical protein [Sphingomonas sp. So64.6b]QNA84171.1 hypothetical protein G4G27_09375 [Sphingomonas sp. So64.6b]